MIGKVDVAIVSLTLPTIKMEKTRSLGRGHESNVLPLN